VDLTSASKTIVIKVICQVSVDDSDPLLSALRTATNCFEVSRHRIILSDIKAEFCTKILRVFGREKTPVDGRLESAAEASDFQLQTLIGQEARSTGSRGSQTVIFERKNFVAFMPNSRAVSLSLEARYEIVA